MKTSRFLRSTIAATAGAVAMATVQAPSATAVDLGFHVTGELVHLAEGFAIGCAAFFNDPVDYQVVVATTLVECWNPGAGGISAPDAFAPGPVAATGIATDGTRSSNTVCARGIFTYVDATGTVKQHDTGIRCDDQNLLA